MAVVNVYVDGFNLYYGALKKTPYKGIHLGKLGELLLPGAIVQEIHYFTARVPLGYCSFSTLSKGGAGSQEHTSSLAQGLSCLILMLQPQATRDASICFGTDFELLPEPISIFNCFGLAASFFCSVIERTPFS